MESVDHHEVEVKWGAARCSTSMPERGLRKSRKEGRTQGHNTVSSCRKPGQVTSNLSCLFFVPLHCKVCNTKQVLSSVHIVSSVSVASYLLWFVFPSGIGTAAKWWRYDGEAAEQRTGRKWLQP